MSYDPIPSKSAYVSYGLFTRLNNVLHFRPIRYLTSILVRVNGCAPVVFAF